MIIGIVQPCSKIQQNVDLLNKFPFTGTEHLPLIPAFKKKQAGDDQNRTIVFNFTKKVP